MILTGKSGLSILQTSSKGRYFSIFKQNINLESYITTLPRRVFTPIIKFRTCNYKLPTETGWWHYVPYNKRKCTLCNQNDLGDDFHYLMKCSFFETERKEFLRPYYYNRCNIIKFQDLLNFNSNTILTKLSKFMKNNYEQFSSEAS